MPRIFEAPPGFVLNPDYLVPELEAQRERLLEALRWIASVNATDREYQAKARAAIKAAEGEKS